MISRSSLALTLACFAAAAVAIGACGLDVVGSLAPGASTDGGASDGERASDGAASDGGPSALPLLDAGTSPDAATALDAGPAPGFCASQPAGWVFCNDFEKSVVGFASQRSTGGSVDLASTSGGNQALRVRVNDGEGTRSVYVTEPLTPLGDMVETGFDVTFVFSVRKSSLGYAVLGGPLLAADPGATAGLALGVAAFDDGVRLDMAGNGAFPSVYWLPGDAWHAAWVRHGKAPVGDPFVQVLVDGVVVAFQRVPKEEDWSALVLRLGGYFTSKDAGSLEVLYDDVLVRTF
jgi:hypothetical protein